MNHSTAYHLDQRDVPLFDSTLRFSARLKAPFYSPGHKGGRSLMEGFAERVVAMDLNNLPGLDNLHCPSGPIRDAEHLLADAYGTKQSFILVGGSTTGNIASIMAACRPGDKLIVQRNVHKSTLAGMVLAEVTPIWVAPEVDSLFGIAHGVAVASVEDAFDKHPDAVGAVILNPTYYGSTSDLVALRDLTRRRNKLLIVDEAHGAHFHFHPSLPVSAEAVGADLIVQSTHKVLSGLSQAAVLHRGTDRVSETAVRRALQLVQTTSPSYPVMASIDVARRQMALGGTALLDEVLNVAGEARTRLAELDDVAVLGQDHFGNPRSGLFSFEQTKIVFGTPGLPIDGPMWQRTLGRDFGVEPELAGPNYLLCILTLGTRQEDIDPLIDAVSKSLAHYRSMPHCLNPAGYVDFARSAAALSGRTADVAMPLRDAFFAQGQSVALESAAGRVASEAVTPYPPGIPVIMPGERILPEHVEFLLGLRSMALPTSASDPTLRTILVTAHE